MIFKQAFRWAFIAIIWKQYKTSIVSTLLLLAYLFIVSGVHQDYLIAVGTDNIERITFVYKWLAWALGIGLFFLYHLIRGRIKPKKESIKEKITESKNLSKTDDDPFAAIRDRKTLRSRADFLMEDKNGKKND